MKDYRQIGGSGLTGAIKGGTVAAAGSIISGVGMTTVPVQILGVITIGSSTVVAAPVVAAVAAGGAVVGGVAAAYSAYRKQNKIEKLFAALTEGVEAAPESGEDDRQEVIPESRQNLHMNGSGE